MPGGRPRKNSATDARQPDATAANVGYEARLWQGWPTRCGAAWTRPNTSTSSWGLIFLKYVSDAFEEQHGKLEADAWRGEKSAGKYEDIPGFCKSATIEEIRKHGHVLTPVRYVGAAAQEDDGEPFEEKMKRLTETLREQQAEAATLDAAIAANLKELGYG